MLRSAYTDIIRSWLFSHDTYRTASTAPIRQNLTKSLPNRIAVLDMDEHTPATSVGSGANSARDNEAIVGIWRAAVERYERDTGTKLAIALEDSVDTASASAIENFIDERAERFASFRADGSARARKWLKPIAATGQLLSSCLGAAVTLVRPDFHLEGDISLTALNSPSRL